MEETNGAAKTPDEPHKDFIAVGIGASAGGIGALKEFFAAMDPNSGMAFVVILHLSPKHDSSLAAILQKETSMPVHQVTGTAKVRPNEVYVIPPNKQLAMLDGSIGVTEASTTRGVRVSIDLFFRTLASAYGRNGVCVVLSGTGTDGTVGLKHVKESNGFAIVQDPGDAEYVTRRLEEELRRTKDRLRTTIEQHETSIEELKASNEELQAINEELRSASEELKTSKEELQSVNDELTTVNHELKDKIEEVSRTNSDLQNLMSSTDIGTIFLDKRLRIKRFTPSVQELFNLITTDIGRPLEHLTHKLEYTKLSDDAETVLRTLTPIQREVRDTVDRTYLLRMLPYRTIDDKIEGVVVTFIDITDRKAAEEILQERSDEISRFNSAMVGRETRMIELKSEINDLLEKSGLEHRYLVEFDADEEGSDDAPE